VSDYLDIHPLNLYEIRTWWGKRLSDLDGTVEGVGVGVEVMTVYDDVIRGW